MKEELSPEVKRRMQEAVEFLYAIPKYTKKNPLSHTKQLMERLGNPQDSFRVIHVAGSNGKGSVCSFLFHILRAFDRSAACFTSPHLTDIRERFRINDGLCSRKDFLEAFDAVLQEAEAMREEGESFPTFFEFLFAMGMLLFQKSGVEYAVLETGMGGRLDATNVVAHPLVCVITSICLEHTEYLGDTIEEIAFEKAGIIKRGVPVVYDANNAAASEIIQRRAEELGAESYGIHKNMCKIRETDTGGIDFFFSSIYDKKTNCFIPFHASYQVMNAALAVTAFWRVARRDGWDLSQEEQETRMQEGLRWTVWPGRMQEVLPDIFFDGAHNPDGIRVFVQAAEELSARDAYRPLLLFSMVRDKDYRQAAEVLLTSVPWEQVCVTGIPSERGLTAEELTETFRAYEQTDDKAMPVSGVDDYREAFQRMQQARRPGQKLFVTGSLYFIGALLEELQKC